VGEPQSFSIYSQVCKMGNDVEHERWSRKGRWVERQVNMLRLGECHREARGDFYIGAILGGIDRGFKLKPRAGSRVRNALVRAGKCGERAGSDGAAKQDADSSSVIKRYGHFATSRSNHRHRHRQCTCFIFLDSMLHVKRGRRHRWHLQASDCHHWNHHDDMTTRRTAIALSLTCCQRLK
jgi:hypothetical protein